MPADVARIQISAVSARRIDSSVGMPPDPAGGRYGRQPRPKSPISSTSRCKSWSRTLTVGEPGKRSALTSSSVVTVVSTRETTMPLSFATRRTASRAACQRPQPGVWMISTGIGSADMRVRYTLPRRTTTGGGLEPPPVGLGLMRGDRTNGSPSKRQPTDGCRGGRRCLILTFW
jgi:hypothetical protein